MAKTNGGSSTFGGKVPTPVVVEKGGGALGAFGTTKLPPEYTLFGDPAEIDNRVATGYRLTGTAPENAAPSFQQIRPGPTGKDANRPDPADMRGDTKFGSVRRYI